MAVEKNKWKDEGDKENKIEGKEKDGGGRKGRRKRRKRIE